MKYRHSIDKTAIKSGAVFDGLRVDNLPMYQAVFLTQPYQLVEIQQDGQSIGHFIYTVESGEFVFHLINCQPVKGGVIERIYRDFVIPLCQARGVEAVVARVERAAMAHKLISLGFACAGGNLYSAEVAHVL